MAVRYQVVLVDDLDGSDADEVVAFGLDGAHYELDLSAAHAARLRAALAPWVAAARATGPAPVAGRGDGGDERRAAVRAWALAAGHTPNERGPLPPELLAAHARATGRSGVR